jgi:hypothetical protein
MHLQVYDVNLLGGNKKHKEKLKLYSDASKEVDLEVNAEKVK